MAVLVMAIRVFFAVSKACMAGTSSPSDLIRGSGHDDLPRIFSDGIPVDHPQDASRQRCQHRTKPE
jgi:hypothetical protein